MTGEKLLLAAINLKVKSDMVEDLDATDSVKLTTYYMTSVLNVDFVKATEMPIIDYRGQQPAGTFGGVRFRKSVPMGVLIRNDDSGIFNHAILDGTPFTQDYERYLAYVLK